MGRDVLAMLWKEYRQFRRNKVNEVGLAVVVAVFFGVAPLLMQMKAPLPGNILSIVTFGTLFLSAFLATTIMSEGVFGEEVKDGTLRMLLTTGIRPAAIFLAKWLALMMRALAIVVVVAGLQLGVLAVIGNAAGGTDLRWTALGIGWGLLMSSYTAAANAAVSLVARSLAEARLLGTIGTMLPILCLGGLAHLLGLGRGAMILLSVLLFVLTAASFLLAFIAFRSERTRA
jgi:ABC-type transport system involved in multi-copper enzyme maturation permease subunit